MCSRLRKFINKHFILTLSVLLICGGVAFANLTSHTEALLDALLLILDSDADGTTADETLPMTAIELGHASDTTIARSGAGAVTIESVPVLTGSEANPSSANGAALGTTALEWSDIYLADGAVIYGQNDQSNTITSGAAGWTFNLFPITPSAAPDADYEVANKKYVDDEISGLPGGHDAVTIGTANGLSLSTQELSLAAATNASAGAATAAQITALEATLPSIDEDAMGSDSAAHVPTQQSVKAYVDGLVGAPTNVTPVDTGDENATFYPLLVDGATGSQATETDAGFSYNPSTNVMTVGGIVTIPSAAPAITGNDSDDAAGTFDITGQSSGGDNAIIMTLAVEESGGSNADYIEVDGVSGTVDLLKPVVVDAAGVKLTGSNGSLTILGLGDGQDEDLKIDLNSTANTIGVSSPASSATAIDFSSLKMITDGVIHGAVNVIKHTAASYTNGTTDANEVRGTYHSNSDDDAFALTLTAGSAGDCGCLSNGQGVTAALTLTPPAGDYLVLDGARGTVATAISSAGAAGDKICWLRIDADDIEITSYKGTWGE